MQGVPYLEGDLRPLQRAAEAHGRSADGAASPEGEGAAETLPADDTPVSGIMSTRVVSFKAGTHADDATRHMLEKGISGAPVVDDDGRPIGMVSKTDLLESLYEGLRAKAQAEADGKEADKEPAVVGDIMVPYLLAVSHRAPIALAAALMAYEGVHRLLVLDEGNKMVGIVSSLDVLRWVAQLSGFCMPPHTSQQHAAP